MTIIRRMLISYQNHSAPNEVQPFFSPDLIRAVHWNLFLVLTAASGFTRILSIPFYFVVCICFVFGLQITIRNLCEKVLRMGHFWYWAEKKWFVLFLKFTTFVFDNLFFGGIILWYFFWPMGVKSWNCIIALNNWNMYTSFIQKHALPQTLKRIYCCLKCFCWIK